MLSAVLSKDYLDGVPIDSHNECLEELGPRPPRAGEWFHLLGRVRNHARIMGCVGRDFDLDNGMLRVKRQPIVEGEDEFFVLRGDGSDEQQLERSIEQYQARAKLDADYQLAMDFVYKHGDDGVLYKNVEEWV